MVSAFLKKNLKLFPFTWSQISFLKNFKRTWWGKLLIPATQEAEIWRIAI
jgi:hypothetical protein